MNYLQTIGERSVASAGPAFDVDAVRAEFPILAERVNDRPLVYLDNAATSQMPRSVLDAVHHFHAHGRANIGRSVHHLGEQATAAYEHARRRAAEYIGASSPREIVFARGTTEAINLVAQSYGEQLSAGDEIMITALEHHANIVPWQMLCQRRGTVLRVAPVDDDGQLIFEEFERLLGPRTRLVAVTQASNALGVMPPLEPIIGAAHDRGARVLIDGAQGAPHLPVDVAKSDADFYAFSGHKLYGPMGVGVLHGKRDLLESMQPYQGGGGMIRRVRFEGTTYERAPQKFEAGTPNVAGAVGLAAAMDFVDSIGRESIAQYEAELNDYAMDTLRRVPGLRLLGDVGPKVGILSFTLEGAHPHDVGTILDRQGIATRTGHHCAQPLMDRLGVPATTRASLAFYNTYDEIDALVDGLARVREVLQ